MQITSHGITSFLHMCASKNSILLVRILFCGVRLFIGILSGGDSFLVRIRPQTCVKGGVPPVRIILNNNILGVRNFRLLVGVPYHLCPAYGIAVRIWRVCRTKPRYTVPTHVNGARHSSTSKL